jgi:hypothetical protein
MSEHAWSPWTDAFEREHYLDQLEREHAEACEAEAERLYGERDEDEDEDEDGIEW